MEYIKPLLVLTLCACGHAYETLSDTTQRGHNVQHLYARQHDDYEPYAYAAVPLHAPMPLLHFLSPSPMHKYAPSRKSRPRRPEVDLHAYASSHVEDYEPYEYSSYSPGQQYFASEEEETQPVVVYARPNRHGGYTYRKRLSRPDVPTTLRPNPEPIVFRIHKYKITRD